MATRCPQCGDVLAEDYICCADARFTWKCGSCGKLSKGFAMPYGACELCGGKLSVVEQTAPTTELQVQAVQTAVEMELNNYHFYNIAAKKTLSAEAQEVFQDMADKEWDHYKELVDKYHIHIEVKDSEMSDEAAEALFQQLFGEVDFSDEGQHLIQIYQRAVRLEEEARDFYLAKVEQHKGDPVEEFYKELAAEEEEHVVILESEMGKQEQFLKE